MELDQGYLISAIFISCVGAGIFLYGKKAQRLWPLLGGLTLSIYPCFITNLYAMWALALGINLGLYALRES